MIELGNVSGYYTGVNDAGQFSGGVDFSDIESQLSTLQASVNGLRNLVENFKAGLHEDMLRMHEALIMSLYCSVETICRGMVGVHKASVLGEKRKELRPEFAGVEWVDEGEFGEFRFLKPAMPNVDFDITSGPEFRQTANEVGILWASNLEAVGRFNCVFGEGELYMSEELPSILSYPWRNTDGYAGG